MNLPTEYQELRQHAEHLAKGPLATRAHQGEPGRLNRDLLRSLATHGLLAHLFPADGTTTKALVLCVIREALARHCTEAETAFALQGLGAYPILLAGTDPVRTRWLPRIARGEAAVGFALTEPEAGSDAARLRLRADRDGDGFRLTGEKTYISHAPEADVYSVFARTTDNGAKGITAFAVPRDSPGLDGDHIDLLAPHPIGRLRFDAVRVDPDQVLGEVDGGWSVAMRTLDMFRPSVGAFAVGMAQAALDAAVAHAAQRQAFGRALSAFQGVSHQLADVATRLHAARLMVHDAACAYDERPGETGHLSAMAKLFATETAQVAVDLAVQVHGARALERGHLLEHLYREVRAPRIYEGASEIQREIIARNLFR
ncbi:acyl-CoA dehydrogenase family protein [Actinokineospora auranticolor]|uniref:Alkylation response protein AidB-like acyl-CoA dehydrogenase n=1 Tax=Actinokineospora auranticolor TaxID=155976 RepID=A0A2S6GEE7_9PSEU|nr:acyl-CoA dehydrogenase family protein [Actinokineospora auranticolor]PPK63595.1 alkylation response protein AidB-like acyl-CoA dehydrogenase [Actinokineospora auranticolor]